MSDSLKRKYVSMIDRLFERTSAGRLEWQLNTERNPTVQISDYYVILTVIEHDLSPIEVVTLTDLLGNPIETFSDESLSGEKPKLKRFDTYWPMMEEMRLKAHRQAVGADRALDRILFDLDDDL